MPSSDETIEPPSPPARGVMAVLDAIFLALNTAGSIWILGLMVLINADIGGRALFNSPILGVEEIVSFSIVGIFFLQLSHSLRVGKVIRNELISSWLERRFPRVEAAFSVLFNLIGVVLLAIVIYASWNLLIRAWETSDHYGNIGVFTFPTWPIKMIIVIGATAAMLQYCLGLFLSAVSLLTGRRLATTPPRETSADLYE